MSLISLRNVSCKNVTKLIANRLKELMPDLAAPNQVSFALIHKMRRMRGHKGFVVVKVDLEETYNSLAWDFIDDTL